MLEKAISEERRENMAITEDDITHVVTIMRIRNSELDFQRIPLTAEKHITELVRLGKYEEIHLAGFERMKDNLGLMAGNEQTQYVYLTVSAIAIWSRAAMEGDAVSDDVFDLSDALLFSLSQCKALEEIRDIYQLAAIMFSKLVKRQQEKKPVFQVERIQNYISRNIFKKITLKEIADYMDLSPNYLCNLFSSSLGISIHQYVQREKVQVACNLLQHTDRSVSDIALYMGFQTQSNFAAIFKKWKGITPSEYRKRNYREVY